MPTFFYGMKPGDEVALEIECGKTLLVSSQTSMWTSVWQRCSSEMNGQSHDQRITGGTKRN